MARAVIRFDVSNPRANQQIADFAGQKITAISEDTREAARLAILEGYRRGDGPIQIATNLAGRIGPSGRREGGILGMSSQQTAWSNNFRDKLSNPETVGEALGYALRDKRFDGTIRKAVAAGEGLSSEQVSKMYDRYVNNAVKLRGETVARTETGAAVHKAAHEAFRQTLDQTEYTEQDVTRTWRSAGDERVRDTHAGMDGQTVKGLEEPFISPSGARLLHPLDASQGAPPEEIINCRCDEEINIDFAAPLRREQPEPEPEPEPEPPPTTTPEVPEPPPALLEEKLPDVLPPEMPITPLPEPPPALVRPPLPEPSPPPPPPPTVVVPPPVIEPPFQVPPLIRRELPDHLKPLVKPDEPIKWPEIPEAQIEAARRRLQQQRDQEIIERRQRMNEMRERINQPPLEQIEALEKQRQAQLRRIRKEHSAKVLVEGKRVAAKLGVDPETLFVSPKLKTFRQGGVKWTTGGEANLATNIITLYPRGLRDVASVPRITAHEVQHVVYETVLKDYRAEYAMLSKETIPFEPSGALRPGRGLEVKYPTYHALQKFHAKSDQLAKDDGVTEYSKAYWRDWAKRKVSTHLAQHETMAEISAELESKGINPGSPIWQEYYRAVQERFAAIKKAKDANKVVSTIPGNKP